MHLEVISAALKVECYIISCNLIVSCHCGTD